MDKFISDLFSSDLLVGIYEHENISYYNREFKKGFYMPSHFHNSIEIMYIIKGSCLINASDKQYNMKNGDFITINCNIPHQLISGRSSPCKILCIEFRFKYIEINHDNNNYSLLNYNFLYENIKSICFFFDSREKRLGDGPTERILKIGDDMLYD